MNSKIHLFIFCAACLMPAASLPAEETAKKPASLAAVPFTEVKITPDAPIWGERLAVNREISLPHNFDWCDKTGRFTNFAKAAGLMEGNFEGIYFNDSDVYKLLEGTAYSLRVHPDAELQKKADAVIAWIAAAQEPNGYINSYYQLREPDRKWTNTPVMHELYCGGHMVEAAVAYAQATGDTKLLEVAEKFMDHIMTVYGPEEGKRVEVPGHEEIELALIKLYKHTGKEKYRDLAKFFIDSRGNTETRTDRLQGLYSQDHKPVREQTEVVGHAVRAMYLYAGMADVAAQNFTRIPDWQPGLERNEMERNDQVEVENDSAALSGRSASLREAPVPAVIQTSDAELMAALNALWDNVAHKKMYITGGVGARHEGEAFGAAFELPNKSAYCETCAAIGLTFWAHRMNLLTGEAEYADVVERAIYNGVLSGIGRDGKSFFYVNPLESDGHHHRQPFFDCACCPTNVVRFVPSLPGYVYAVRDPGTVWRVRANPKYNFLIHTVLGLGGGESADGKTEVSADGKQILEEANPGADKILVNLFIPGKSTIQLGAGKVEVVQETNYPWDGKVKLSLSPLDKNAPKHESYTLAIRIPEWVEGDVITENYVFGKIESKANRPLKPGNGESYAGVLTCSMNTSFSTTFVIPMKPFRNVANPRVEANRGRVAVQRGPVVYCFEQCDNEVPVDQIILAKNPEFTEVFEKDLLGGVVVLKCKNADGRELTAVPYFAWDSREPGKMAVWVKQEGLTRRPDVNDPAWTNAETGEPILYRKLTAEMLRETDDPLTLSETLIPSASHCFPRDSVYAVLQDTMPSNSCDHDIPRLTFWDHRGTAEWVTLQRDTPFRVSKCGIYWFDDTGRGGCRVPESATISYLSDGEWKKLDTPVGVEKDTLNTVSFPEIETTGLRLNIQLQEGVSGGILKWTVE